MARKTNSRKATRGRKVSRGHLRILELWQGIYRYRVLFVLVIFIFIPALLGYLGYINQMTPQIQRGVQARLAKVGFAVKDIMVEGRIQTSVDDLLKVIKVRRGDCLFACDPYMVQAALKDLPWIQSATIERRWPDIIYVRLVEHTPLALWQNQGKFYLVDQSGEVIHTVLPKDYRHLPVIVGKGAPQHFASLLAILDQAPGLSGKMKAAVLISERRWDLILDGLRVKLPQKDVLRAVKQLVQMEQDHQLSRRNVTTIDLRLPDRSFLYVTQNSETRIQK
ncbi:MAG: cell division protein FtsQ/DivIB [Pseudomonadota bacterium]